MRLSDLLPSGYVDAHHHVWAPESLGEQIGYGWLRDIGAPKPFGDPTPIQRDYLMMEFLAEASVAPRASIHVQTDGALADPVAETRFVQAQADAAGHAVKIVALVDLSADNLADTLSDHAESRDFCGVRQIVARLSDRPDLSFAPRDYLSDPQWIGGLKQLEDRGLTFDLQMYPEQASAALEALSATPALKVIIDHALCPYDQSVEGQNLWAEAVSRMAKRPNTYMKLSGWGMYENDWAERGVGFFAPYIDVILKEFGPERVMWGSNYPVEKLATPYETCLRNVVEYLPPESVSDVFYHSAAEAYGLKLT
ncbi:amidohydrolase family protein [Gymnodinialimonas ceratoperidinii]|uniref:Amidohydrolase family protein n=1 Tax=Gymnodinialimonas ceratoperidinii TaxID=2856823 RepID=A0A8F6TUG3_9RHOB|nr:amidohydrolase family protein [Gymnodinialimonas ceratoperidinii]QXT38359.1 amidohydrolase family protein [Gymnodinialimonas ceratoperidinii]